MNLADVLNKAESMKSFSSLQTFPTIKKNANEEKQKETYLNELFNNFNSLNILDIIKIINEQKWFGKVFENKDENKTELFFPDLNHDAKSIQIETGLDHNDNSMVIIKNLTSENEAIKNFLFKPTKEDESDKNIEFLEYLVNIQYPLDRQEKIKEFVNYSVTSLINNDLNSDKKTELLNQKNSNELSIRPIVKDEVYKYLSFLGNESERRIYIKNIGFFYQQNNMWQIIEKPHITIELNDTNTFFDFIETYGVPRDKLISAYQNYVNEINKPKEQTVKTTSDNNESNFPDYDESYWESLMSEASRNTYDIDDQDFVEISNSEMFIPDDILYEEQQKITQQTNINNQKYQQLEKINETSSPIVEHNFEDMLSDNIDYINSLMQQSQEEKDSVNDILSMFDYEAIRANAYSSLDNEVDEQEEKVYNAWDKLNQLTDEINLEDLVELENFIPKLNKRNHNGNVYFKRTQYSTEKPDSEFVVSNNNWLFLRTKESGDEISEFFKVLYLKNNILLEETKAEDIIALIENNRDKLENLKNKRITRIRDLNMIQTIEDVLKKYASKYPFVLDITNIEEKTRNNSTNFEYTINKKTYRFKNNMFYCIEDAVKGEGLDELLLSIYQDDKVKIEEKRKSYQNLVTSNENQDSLLIELENKQPNNKQSISKTSNENDVVSNTKTTQTPNASESTNANDVFNETHEANVINSNITTDISEQMEELSLYNTYDDANEHYSEVFDGDDEVKDSNHDHLSNQNKEIMHSDVVNNVLNDSIESSKNNESSEIKNKKEINAQHEVINKNEEHSTNFNSDEVKKHGLDEHLAEQIDKNQVIENFNNLVNQKLKQLLDKRSLLQNFKSHTFLEFCTLNNSPYSMEKIGEDQFILGKGKNRHTISSKDFKTAEDIVSHVLTIYKKLEHDTEFKRVSNIMLPVLTEKVAEQLRLQLLQKEEQLIDKQIKEKKQENVIDEHILNNEEQFDNPEKTNELFQPAPKKEKLTPQEELDKLMGLDQATLTSPTKPYLHNYFFEYAGKIIKLRVDALLNKLKKNNDDFPQDLDISSEFKDNYVINFKIQKGNDFLIKGTSGLNKERWEVVKNNIGFKFSDKKDSLISLIEDLHKIYNIPLRHTYLNKVIGERKEFEFFNSFPMHELLKSFNTKKESVNYILGNLKIGITQEYGKAEAFQIWNTDLTPRCSTAELMCVIMAEENGEIISKEIFKNPKYSFIKGINKLREIYLNMDSIDKITLAVKNKSDNANTLDDKIERFNIMLPVANTDSKMMKKYLMKRGINPEVIDELDGLYIYEGMYEHQHKSESIMHDFSLSIEERDRKLEELERLPVVVFNTGEAASVRGITVSGDHIKMNVPGSRNLEANPYSIEPSKKYVRKDDKVDYKMVVCEGAIDAISYRCLYPTAYVQTNFGLAISRNMIAQTLKNFYELVNNKDNSVHIVYALDNIGLNNKTGEPLDKPSRDSYFSLVSEMQEFCYEQFVEKHKEELINFEYENSQLYDVLLQIITEKHDKKYSEEQLERFENELKPILFNNHSQININSNEIKEKLGELMFDFDYIDSGVFMTEQPELPQYGQYKDWNELLENMVHQKYGEIFLQENTQLNIQDNHFVSDIKSVLTRLKYDENKIDNIIKQLKQNETDLNAQLRIIGKLVYNENFIEHHVNHMKIEPQQVHEQLVLELNPDLIEVSVKKELKKQEKLEKEQNTISSQQTTLKM